jgi:hypothetical protein
MSRATHVAFFIIKRAPWRILSPFAHRYFRRHENVWLAADGFVPRGRTGHTKAWDHAGRSSVKDSSAVFTPSTAPSHREPDSGSRRIPCVADWRSQPAILQTICRRVVEADYRRSALPNNYHPRFLRSQNPGRGASTPSWIRIYCTVTVKVVLAVVVAVVVSVAVTLKV